MIFPKIQCDDYVQVADKFRIDAGQSYVSKGESAITAVEIEAEAGSGFVNVTGSTPINSLNWYLDWEYATAGNKVVTVRVTTDGAPTSVTKTVVAATLADDNLFSDDEDIASIETDVLKYLPKGRSSFKFMHREAQNEIMEWLYTNGYTKADKTRFTKEDVVDLEEFNYWSKYLTLRLIFEDVSKQETDVFARKAKEYESDEHKWRHKSVLKIDVDGDGTQGSTEGFNITTKSFRRV